MREFILLLNTRWKVYQSPIGGRNIESRISACRIRWRILGAFSRFKFHFLMIGFTAIFATSISNAQKETLIPRSMPGDKGRYYLMESKKGNVIQALHKRVGIDSIVSVRTETNCKTRRMRELRVSESSLENIKQNATDWVELVPSSSKSDLAASSATGRTFFLRLKSHGATVLDYSIHSPAH